jgi:hypothetical protein
MGFSIPESSMLCPRCHGTHVIVVNGRPQPCPECQGMGEIHCCDGLIEQPEACELPRQPPPAEAPGKSGDV